MTRQRSIRLPVRQPASRAAVDAPRRRDYSRWRAISLMAVYALMAAHIAHWRLAGKTLAPLELNEVLYTLELGIVTAGFIFMSLAVVSVFIFGRFFCSWGCHILALQDLCEWLLGKMGIRPKPVRSRLLLLVGPGAMFYMFIWPHVMRAWEGRSTPPLRVLSDGQGWASFVTDDFWRNLPGPWVAGLTFLVCGFLIVYALGSRSFCTYACPYGAIFSFADRFAPGKIVARGDCTSCGLCTAACQSNIRVHQEVMDFGKVVSPACLKDLDCVSVCPTGALAYGFTMPSLFKSWRRFGRFGVPYDYTLGEEAVAAAVFLGSLLVFRGLYDAVPFLLTLGLGAILAHLAVLSWRLCRTAHVRLNQWQLKRAGRLTLAGWAYLGLGALLAMFAAHCGFIRYHEAMAARGFGVQWASLQRGEFADRENASEAIRHAEMCERWGLVRPAVLHQRLAILHVIAGDPSLAELHIAHVIEAQPENESLRLTTAAILLMRGNSKDAVTQLHAVTDRIQNEDEAASNAVFVRAAAHQMLGDIHAAMGEDAKARKEYERSQSLQSAHR